MPEEISAESTIKSSAVLDCVLQLPRAGPASRKGFVEVTLGHADGSVQTIRLDQDASKRLVERCGAVMLEPPRSLYGTRQWMTRRSVLRAESRVEHDEERIAFDTKRLLPDVAEFVEETILGLRKMVCRRGRSQEKPDTVCRRMRTALLVLVDALRNDT